MTVGDMFLSGLEAGLPLIVASFLIVGLFFACYYAVRLVARLARAIFGLKKSRGENDG